MFRKDLWLFDAVKNLSRMLRLWLELDTAFEWGGCAAPFSKSIKGPIAPFDFYTNDAQLSCNISKACLNDSAAATDIANKGGSGAYLILETDADWDSSASYSISQRTIVIASNAIINATPEIIPATKR